MNSWKVILATIVIFGAGVVTGGLLVNHVEKPFHSAPTPPPGWSEVPPQLRPEMLNYRFVQRLNDRLNLKHDQRQKIERIIADGQKRTRDLWKLVGPQFQSVWRDTRLQIREVLTPEQRRQFEELMRQQHPLRHPPATNAPPELPHPGTNSPAI